MMTITPLSNTDHGPVATILHAAFCAGDSFAVAAGMDPAACLAWWTAPDKSVWVARNGETVLGTYFLRAKGEGPGAHVSTCGYVTAAHARRRGVASAMLAHSLGEARRRGYRAMQLNTVAAGNDAAIRIWQRAGFATVGRVPGAFHHPQLGYVDVLIMYKPLVDDPHA